MISEGLDKAILEELNNPIGDIMAKGYNAKMSKDKAMDKKKKIKEGSAKDKKIDKMKGLK